MTPALRETIFQIRLARVEKRFVAANFHLKELFRLAGVSRSPAKRTVSADLKQKVLEYLHARGLELVHPKLALKSRRGCADVLFEARADVTTVQGILGVRRSFAHVLHNRYRARRRAEQAAARDIR